MAVCRKSAVHTLCVESTANEQSDEEILSINVHQVVALAHSLIDDKWSVCVTIQSQQVSFRIDTGA